MKITGNKLKRNTVKAPTLVPAEKHVFAITNVTKGVKNKRNLNLSRMTHLFFFLNVSLLTSLYLKKTKTKTFINDFFMKYVIQLKGALSC